MVGSCHRRFVTPNDHHCSTGMTADQKFLSISVSHQALPGVSIWENFYTCVIVQINTRETPTMYIFSGLWVLYEHTWYVSYDLSFSWHMFTSIARIKGPNYFEGTVWIEKYGKSIKTLFLRNVHFSELLIFVHVSITF